MLTRMEDGNIYLSVLVDENLGDEDGFGVEPDDYLVGIVAPDGTFVELLLLASIPPYAIEADTQRNEHNNNRPQNSS